MDEHDRLPRADGLGRTVEHKPSSDVCRVCGSAGVLWSPDLRAGRVVERCTRCMWRFGVEPVGREHWVETEDDLSDMFGPDLESGLGAWVRRVGMAELEVERGVHGGLRIYLQGMWDVPDVCLDVDFPLEMAALSGQVEDLARRALVVDSAYHRLAGTWERDGELDS